MLDYDLQRQLHPYMTDLTPLPSIYYPDFIAANQEGRADNVLPGHDKQQHLDTIRQNIRDFKQRTGVDKVLVMWTANTERFSDVSAGLNDTSEALLTSIKNSHHEVSPSTIFAVASILENCSYINGSPQNTCVPVRKITSCCARHIFCVKSEMKMGMRDGVSSMQCFCDTIYVLCCGVVLSYIMFFFFSLTTHVHCIR